jgi:hypothetical protein
MTTNGTDWYTPIRPIFGFGSRRPGIRISPPRPHLIDPASGWPLTTCPAAVYERVVVLSQLIGARGFDVVFDPFKGRGEHLDEHSATVRVHLRRLVIEDWGIE